MRAISLFLSATALLTATGLAQAGTGTIQARPATAQQMAEVNGSYQLSDGRRIHIFVADQQLYAKIGQSQAREIVSTGPNRFSTRDGSIDIQFGSELGTMTIQLAHDRNIAPEQDRIRLASNNRNGRGGAD